MASTREPNRTVVLAGLPAEQWCGRGAGKELFTGDSRSEELATTETSYPYTPTAWGVASKMPNL